MFNCVYVTDCFQSWCHDLTLYLRQDIVHLCSVWLLILSHLFKIKLVILFLLDLLTETVHSEVGFHSFSLCPLPPIIVCCFSLHVSLMLWLVDYLCDVEAIHLTFCPQAVRFGTTLSDAGVFQVVGRVTMWTVWSWCWRRPGNTAGRNVQVFLFFFFHFYRLK